MCSTSPLGAPNLTRRSSTTCVTPCCGSSDHRAPDDAHAGKSGRIAKQLEKEEALAPAEAAARGPALGRLGNVGQRPPLESRQRVVAEQRARLSFPAAFRHGIESLTQAQRARLQVVGVAGEEVDAPFLQPG